jgi:hypothetical protein
VATQHYEVQESGGLTLIGLVLEVDPDDDFDIRMALIEGVSDRVLEMTRGTDPMDIVNVFIAMMEMMGDGMHFNRLDNGVVEVMTADNPIDGDLICLLHPLEA